MSDENVDFLTSPFLNFYTYSTGNTVTTIVRLLETVGEKR